MQPHIRVSILWPLLATAAFASGFHSFTSGPWAEIFSAIGLQPGAPESARVVVLGPGAGASAGWAQRVEQGALLILEGESPVAESFGFRGGSQRVRVAGITDARRPKLPIIWREPLELPRFSTPPEARVFASERWTRAPVMAGYRRGAGAVLWVAAGPGTQGYERFPYLLHALHDLGLEAPFRSNRLWAFFDSSYRMRVDPDYFAARWRASGIAALHVAAWHFFEPDKERDRYLSALIDACHRHGVLVYAWLELPHVSDKFWNDHPEWREKTALLQDAHLDWRRLMNLTNRDCFQAVSEGVRALLGRFDWDGVNLAELYFESLEGARNPSRFTPMNDDVRRLFRETAGYDPLENFSARTFLDFRAHLARRMQGEWMAELQRHRQSKAHLDLVLTHVDDRFDTGMKDSIGADAARALELLDEHDFTFLIEDPATVWHLGPKRYPEIAARYQPLTRHGSKLAVDINIAERYQDVYPTKQQTGTELFQLVHLAAGSFPRVALYFEKSLEAPDLPLLAAAAAAARRRDNVVESPRGIGIPWKGAARVDGRLWPVVSDSVVWLPAGSHTVEPAPAHPPLRVTDFNGDLLAAAVRADGAVEIIYQAASRAIALLSRRPEWIDVDGPVELLAEATVILPPGKHTAAMR